jgi:hypothetical protein
MENTNATIWRQIENLRLFSEDAIKFMDNGGLNSGQEDSTSTESVRFIPDEMVPESDLSEIQPIETTQTLSSIKVASTRQTLNLFKTEKKFNDDEYYYYDTDEKNIEPQKPIDKQNHDSEYEQIYEYEDKYKNENKNKKISGQTVKSSLSMPDIKNYKHDLISNKPDWTDDQEYHEYEYNENDFDSKPTKTSLIPTTELLKELFVTSTVKKQPMATSTVKTRLLVNKSTKNRFNLCVFFYYFLIFFVLSFTCSR